MAPRKKVKIHIQMGLRRFVRHRDCGDHVYVPLEEPSKAFAWDRKELEQRLALAAAWVCEEGASLSVRFCSMDEMRDANRDYRGKDEPTDVLSFPAAQVMGQTPGFLGDLLVCLPVVEAQARRYRKTFAQECEKMLLHGLAHLKGFDHERGSEAHAVQTALEKALGQSLCQSLGEPRWLSL